MRICASVNRLVIRAYFASACLDDDELKAHGEWSRAYGASMRTGGGLLVFWLEERSDVIVVWVVELRMEFVSW